jgi:SAM-dependent methyltransferase
MTMKLYSELAEWFPILTGPADYAEEAASYRDLMVGAVREPVRTVLELGSGGGNNASHLKQHFTMTLVEPSPGMRAVSSRLNPECEHVAGDMRTVRLGRTFDAVFVHDAVCYMTTEQDLRAAMDTAFAHTRPGGAVLFAPDYVREKFKEHADCGGNDVGDRSLRYLEWTWDPDPRDTTYIVDYAYMLREGNTAPRVVHDRHVEGLFWREEWLRWLTDAGFTARMHYIDHTELEPWSYEVFVGVHD